MKSKVKVIPTDVYKNGDLHFIHFHDLEGKFIVQTEWDWVTPEEQTSKNREAFRKWSYRIVEQLDDGKYIVIT